jgi:hypothetical protein
MKTGGIRYIEFNERKVFAMAMDIIRKTREVVDGVEYNVTYLKGAHGTSTVYDPVRTPEQQAKRDETLRQVAVDYAKACIRAKGIEWAKEHLLVYEDGKDSMERTADRGSD